MTRVKPSVGLFLIGCSALPFFNDFPYFQFITPSFLDLSLVFFVLATIFLFFETIVGVQRVKINKNAILFYVFLVVILFASYLFNITKSSNICGVEECGSDRMVKTLLADLIKFSLIPIFVHFVNSIGLEKVASYIRFGFYISFIYVSIEIFFSVIPYLLGLGRLDFMNSIDSIFHQRENNWGALRTRGLAFEPGYQGFYLILCLPFLVSDRNISRKRKGIYCWILCLLTTMAPGALLAGLVFFLLYKLKSQLYYRVKYVLLILFVVVPFVIYLMIISGADFISSITRIGSWTAAMHAIVDNPFWGVGPGMAGFWVSKYYPDFFYISAEAGQWEMAGIDYLNAPTFASLFNYILNYGLFLNVLFLGYFYRSILNNNVLKSNVGRAGFWALVIVSFTITSYQVMGYFIFIAICLSNGWKKFD